MIWQTLPAKALAVIHKALFARDHTGEQDPEAVNPGSRIP